MKPKEKPTTFYWVTCVINDYSGVWACHLQTPYFSLEEAMKEVNFKREHYPVVVCAFIEKQVGGSGKMKPVYADCFIDVLGREIKRKETSCDGQE